MHLRLLKYLKRDEEIARMRNISYVQAINETLKQLIESDERVYLLGQGVNSPWYAGKSTEGLSKRFGSKKIFDTPISENGLTGAAIGSALAGMRPIVFQSRMDFMLYSMDPLINQAANWYFMFGGQLSVPLTIWAIINRGGEQGAQHSQALQALFAHIPGLKVVMPSTPYDAKGLLVSSVQDDNPVIFIDDRWLYEFEGDVPEELYSIPLGKGIVRREGKDVTIVATSFMVQKSLEAAKELEKRGVDVEIIDPRTLKPLDESLILKSIEKTGRLVIVDAAWKTGGIGAEISAIVSEKAFRFLKAPIMRVALPDTPAPVNSIKEKQYYLDQDDIITTITKLMLKDSIS
jgi:acetoin:2,6-dichlorophenolindophenol oxidoreductase subunit beta